MLSWSSNFLVVLKLKSRCSFTLESAWTMKLIRSSSLGAADFFVFLHLLFFLNTSTSNLIFLPSSPTPSNSFSASPASTSFYRSWCEALMLCNQLLVRINACLLCNLLCHLIWSLIFPSHLLSHFSISSDVSFCHLICCLLCCLIWCFIFPSHLMSLYPCYVVCSAQSERKRT